MLPPVSVPVERLVAPCALVTFYFVSLGICLVHALADLPWSLRFRRAHEDKPSRPTALSARLTVAARNIGAVLFAFANAALAWYHIGVFMMGDCAQYDDMWVWIADSSWFVKAYELVTASPPQWYFSSQLLQGVGSIVVFTYVESFRAGRVRPLSSFWLGCSAAISLAFPLFVAAVWNTPSEVYKRRHLVPQSRLLAVCVVLSSLAVSLLPRVDESSPAYGVVLGTIHVSLLLPLAVAQWFPASVGPGASSYQKIPASANDAYIRRRGLRSMVASSWVQGLYGIVAGMSLMTHFFNVMGTLEAAGGIEAVVRQLSAAVCSNPCQCSISGDVVATSLFTIVTIGAMSELSVLQRACCMLMTPILSFSVTLPVALYWREAALCKTNAADLLRLDARSAAATPPPAKDKS